MANTKASELKGAIFAKEEEINYNYMGIVEWDPETLFKDSDYNLTNIEIIKKREDKNE